MLNAKHETINIEKCHTFVIRSFHQINCERVANICVHHQLYAPGLSTVNVSHIYAGKVNDKILNVSHPRLRRGRKVGTHILGEICS